MSRLLDEGTAGRVAEPISAPPYRLYVGVLEQSEPVRARLVGEHGRRDAHLVVVEPTDGHAQPLSAVRVLRFDQDVPDFNPRGHRTAVGPAKLGISS
jgi:hypothetical protein